jgi:hypothetical protein
MPVAISVCPIAPMFAVGVSHVDLSQPRAATDLAAINEALSCEHAAWHSDLGAVRPWPIRESARRCAVIVRRLLLRAE